MKARHIKKLRKRILSKEYYNKRIFKIANDLEDWNNFDAFDCSSFFRGHELAKLNQKTYDRVVPRLKNKFIYYEKKLNKD